MKTSLAGVLVAVLLPTLLATGCLESEKPTCEYWSPRLTSAAQGDKALQMVEELKCAEAIPTLGQLFDDGQYRERILRILKQIGDRDAAAPVLRRGLTAKDTSKLAASIVGDWALAEARPELEQILTGTTLPKYRLEALQALLAFERPEGIAPLLIQLAGADPNFQGIEVNKLAIEKLGDAQSDAAADVLVQAAFLRDNAGRTIYAPARRALAKVGKAVIPKLIQTIEGKNEALEVYARQNGLADWQIQGGAEIVQLLTDTLDPSVGKVVVAGMKKEIKTPLGISPAAQEKWRVAEMNRLKLSFLGLGHIGPVDVIKDLGAIVADPLADAVNQRLHSATSLALIGTPAAQDLLLQVFHAETSDNFREPLLRPLALGLDWPHYQAFHEAITKDRKTKASERIINALATDAPGKYIGVLQACKTDTGCYIKKLQDPDKDVVIKSALILMRGGGDVPAIRQALIKRFVNSPSSALDIRRFTLMAITRLGTAAEGDELLKIARNLDRSESYWEDELTICGNWLKHRR